MGAQPDFDEFVAARSQRLLRTAYLLTRDHALAEDLLQTALTKAWFAWSRIDGDPDRYTVLLDGEPHGGTETVGRGAAGPSWETVGVLDAQAEGFGLRLRALPGG